LLFLAAVSGSGISLYAACVAMFLASAVMLLVMVVLAYRR
jgi:hypothetical protein